MMKQCKIHIQNNDNSPLTKEQLDNQNNQTILEYSIGEVPLFSMVLVEFSMTDEEIESTEKRALSLKVIQQNNHEIYLHQNMGQFKKGKNKICYRIQSMKPSESNDNEMIFQFQKNTLSKEDLKMLEEIKNEKN